MSDLFIGARHLHAPLISVMPVLHGFLVLDDEQGYRTTFGGDQAQGLPFGSPLVLYEERYTAGHGDAHGVVVLRLAWPNITAEIVRTSFRTTQSRIGALNLIYNPLTRNCNMVVSTLVLQAGLALPPPPARFVPGYGQSIL